MVDFEAVFTKVKRGAFVGAGAFGATFVDDWLFSDMNPTNTAVGQVAVGAGVSIAADYAEENAGLDDEMMGHATDALEFGGYGIQGAGWSSLADRIQTESRASTSPNRSTVKVRSDASSSNGNKNEMSANARVGSDETERSLNLDTA